MATEATKAAQAAAAIVANPRLRGYARVGGAYSGRFGYGRGTPRPEMKFHDTVFRNFDIGGKDGNVHDGLCKISQGVGQSQRVGRKITVRGVLRRAICQLSWKLSLTFCHRSKRSTFEAL